MPPAEVHSVYLALGSNLGDRPANLQRALAGLPPAVWVLAQSSVYVTAPWGFADQPAFLNQVVQAQTSMLPLDLLGYLKELEKNLGRQAGFRNGPRLIDLDILLYEDWIFNSATLVIPHPRLHERSFVLVPFAELAPELRHPVLGKTMRELQRSVGSEGVHPFL